ncbi:putative quorum-sensing-regulated virulence factor [Candidatus Similichlamydia epinepheli]|uniref:putative quorum-sensing-regulated virulence factor n=1 Tax=Candidatus Similichlamydia epinepheli TaxID=1903953 RepID=UPI001EFE5511|nr:DUF3820 family protein [Candidatus Similichlamydia epinepheli]
MQLNAVFFDIETTGLDLNKDRIVEIAAFCPASGEKFTSLVCPGQQIPSDASAIHGIYDHMVAEAPSFDKIGSDFLKFCSMEGTPVLIAHNGKQFDIPFIENELKRFDLDLPKHWLTVDTLQWARKYRSDLPRHSLQFLRETFGIPNNQAHRAMDDVLTLFEVFSDLVGDLPLEIILKKLDEPDVADRVSKGIMPFGKHHGKPLQEIPSSYLKWLNESGALEKTQNQWLKEELKTLKLI